TTGLHMEQGFLSQKGSGVGRGVKEKQVSIGLKLVDRTKSKTDTGTGLFTKSDGTLNDAHPLKEPSYATATATGKPNGKKVSVCTLFTPGGNEIDMVVPIYMDGLDAILENGPWFIWNNPLIQKKWHPDENLLKENERHYTCNDYEEYEWKPPRCSSCKVFGHIHEECPKNTGAGEKKTVKKPSQTSQGKSVEPTIAVSNSNPFDVLNSVDNDVEFGTNRRTTNLVNNGAASSGSSFMNIDNDGQFASNTPIGEKIDKIERQICEGKLRLSDNDENLLVSTSIVESDSEVEVVFDETANLRILTSGKDRSEKGYGINSLLKQLRDSYPDNDDYDPYDDDI
nr:hypothetical protein [Tanacetum cinerariifolium]